MEGPVFEPHGWSNRGPFGRIWALFRIDSIAHIAHHRYIAQPSTRQQAGDTQVPGTPAVYADPRMELLLARLTPMVEAEAGVTVYPSYSYFRVYKKGDRLKKHKDRPSCEISLSLSLGYDPDEPWPLWVEGDAGATELRITRGDAVLYKGTAVAHWREEFQGNYAAQVFLHYVDQKGPYREWRFDKREAALNQSSAT
jgi:hypothetical protein